MNLIMLIIASGVFLVIGGILGYVIRQSIAKRQKHTIEAKLNKLISEAKLEGQKITSKAKTEADKISEKSKLDERKNQNRIFRTQERLARKEETLDQRLLDYEKNKEEIGKRIRRVKEIKEEVEDLKQKEIKELQRITGLNTTQAKKEFFLNLEKDYQKDIIEKIKKLEEEGKEVLEKRAKEILTLAIQKIGISQTSEVTTTTVALPNDDLKGRIIGKEGRNIRTIEKLTGVEIIVDETPETVVLSAFDPVRRQIAKIALEKLISDGRIQPARIEEKVNQAKKEIVEDIKEAGETAVYDTQILDLDPKLIKLLGRLKYRTSYGQSVLLHSLEVCHLAGAIAAELGARQDIAKKAGLLHDIGKSVDHQIEGSHVDIGIKILEKFGVEEEVIKAMKSHHEEYPPENLEAVIVQTADAISGSRPGARKDTLENYLKRLEELEKLATSFKGVEKAWALQAGREIRVFIKPEEVDDLGAHKLARQIAQTIQEELRYPGEIKVNVIRETRVIEYAK